VDAKQLDSIATDELALHEGIDRVTASGREYKLWEYVVLRINSGYPLDATAQLNGDRIDAEDDLDGLSTLWVATDNRFS
jgi:hypothetical protein